MRRATERSRAGRPTSSSTGPVPNDNYSAGKSQLSGSLHLPATITLAGSGGAITPGTDRQF
jgi:hypothetical protein